MQEIAPGLWHGPGRRADDLAAWSLFACETGLVAAVGLTPGRAHIGLPVVLANGRSQGKVRDSSRRPGLWEGSIRSAAIHNDIEPQLWIDAITEAFLGLAHRHGWSIPARNRSLSAVVISAVWPTLLSASEAGMLLPSEVPRWSRDLLSGPTPRLALKRVLGPRGVDGVLEAGSECFDHSIDWWTLACALAAVECPTEALSRILRISVSGPMLADDEFENMKDYLSRSDGETIVCLLADTARQETGPSRLINAFARAPEDMILAPSLGGVELSSLRPR